MDFTSAAIDPAMGIVVLALVAFGYFLKSTPDIPDWLIGWILLILAIVAALFKVGASVDGVINGVLAASLAVYSHSLFKQTTVNRIEDRTGQPTTATAIDLPKVEIKSPEDAQKIVDAVNETSAPILA